MSNRGVSFDIETRGVLLRDHDIMLMCNPIELGTWVHMLFELLSRDSHWHDDPIFLYPSEMHLADQFPGREVREIEDIPVNTANLYRADFAATERRQLAYMNSIDGCFRALDLGLDDMIRTMKTSQLKALPHEPHRTYDWRQRLPSHRRKR